MKKYAVIVIGSNSVRLLFVADGKVLYKRLKTTRLGEGIAFSSTLKKEAIVRSALAVEEFFRQAKKEGAEDVFAFATAAVRSAKNGNQFVDYVKEKCGLTIEVLSGEEEAEIGVKGALGDKDGALVDVGGASTELVVIKDGAFAYKKSINIGVVRLKDTCGRDKVSLEKTCALAVEDFDKTPNIKELYAVGGTATTLMALALGLTQYDSAKITGGEISLENLCALADKLLATPVEEIAKMPCITEGRADVIAGGAVLLYAVMQKTGAKKLIVSDRDNLEGYALKKGWKL